MKQPAFSLSIRLLRWVGRGATVAGLLAGSWACSGTSDEQPELMVPLRTVRSGPALQAQELNGAIARQPQNAGLYARRAEFRLDAGQPDAALQDLAQALQLDDNNGRFHYLRARALRAQGRLDRALAAATEAARHGYASSDLTLLMGETNLAARYYTTALDYLDRTLQQEPDNASALFYKGLAYVGLQDTVQALAYLQASAARDARQPEILHQVAFLANAYRQPLVAAPFASRGLRLAPTYGPLLYDYGRQFDLQAQPDSALRYYRRALQHDTTFYRADYRVGLAYFKNRQYQAAVPHLQRALRRSTRLPGCRQMLAESFEALGRLPEAQVQYQQLVLENPGNRHWTFKAWKTRTKAPALLPDSAQRPAPVAPLSGSQPALAE